MAGRPTLIGLPVSVYTRAVRLALLEKGIDYEFTPVDPFQTGGPPEWFLALNPFGKVPVLRQDDFVLYETAAILRYLDEAFAGVALQPAEPRGRARMQQIIGIVDSFAYRPMVWGLYVEVLWRPLRGEQPDPGAVTQALIATQRCLAALAALAEAPYLLGPQPTLADLHLAPHLAYLRLVPEGAAALAAEPRLLAWWERISARPGWAALLAPE